MGIYAKRHEIDLRGLTVSVDKDMSQDAPRRIARTLIGMSPCPEIKMTGRKLADFKSWR